MEWREWKCIIAVLALVVFTTLAGCSKDDKSVGPNGGGNIIGTWNLTGMTSRVGDETYEVPREEIEADPLSYAFEADSTGIQYYQDQETVFHWSTNGSTLTTTSYYETISYAYSVTSSTLKLVFQVEIYEITHSFTRQ